jgi:hypothetical protein
MRAVSVTTPVCACLPACNEDNMQKIKFLFLAATLLSGLAVETNSQCVANFNSTSSVNVGGSPDSLASGDFNRDGRLDLAVASRNFSSVSILINQGSGRFSLTLSYDVGNAPSGLASADYNKDGKIDIAVVNQNTNTFTLLRGNGDGTFIAGFTFSTLAQPSAIVFADLNLDGSQDIAVMHLTGTTISVWLGDGTGTFVNSINLTHPQFRGGTRIIVSDMNLDGKPDVIATGILNSGGFDYPTGIVALNAGTGFGAFNFIGITSWSSTLYDAAVTDVNNDGKPDIVWTVTTAVNDLVKYTVSRGNGTGAFPIENTTYDLNAFTGKGASLTVGDFNADGKLDVMFANENSSTTSNLFLMSGGGAGTFGSAIPFVAGAGNSKQIIAGDFDGDGKTDIAASDPAQNKVNITRNTCGGGWTKPKADFDGDGKTDRGIFRPSLGEWWYRRSSDGGSRALQFGNSADRPTPGDYTGDGKVDIAFWRPSTGYWFILRSEDSSFYSFPFGTNGDIPATGDYDGDGKTDAALFRPSTSIWYMGLSTGGTTFAQFGQNGDLPLSGD